MPRILPNAAWRCAVPSAALVLLAACSREPAPAKPLAPPPLAAFVVASAEAPHERVWDGIVEATNATTLAAQTNARVQEIAVDAGDRVAQGEVLMRLSDVEQSAGRRGAQAAVTAAQANARQAEANFKRIDDIFARQLVARADLDAATAQRDAARAALAAAQAQLRSAGQQADYTVVRAPFDGVITQRFVDVGQAVQSGPPQPQPLLMLAALDALRAEATVPQEVAQAIRQHGSATLLLDGGARRVPAASVNVLPTADPATHTFRVRVGIPPGTAGMWPGMTVRIAFAAGNASRLQVPVSAVMHRGEIDGVYVIGADNRVALRLLRLGQRDGADVDVLAGLASGERVARDPQAAMRWLVAQRGKSP